MHLQERFRVVCEDQIVTAARMVYQLDYLLRSLFKGRLGVQQRGDGMREVSIGNTRMGLW